MPALDDLIKAEDVRILADIGFMAVSRGKDHEAEMIFEGVAAARPNNEAGPIGLALVRLMRNEVHSAVAILRKLPPSDAAQMFLGMALARAGQIDDARAILEDVASTGEGGPADAAKTMLTEIR